MPNELGQRSQSLSDLKSLDIHLRSSVTTGILKTDKSTHQFTVLVYRLPLSVLRVLNLATRMGIQHEGVGERNNNFLYENKAKHIDGLSCITQIFDLSKINQMFFK